MAVLTIHRRPVGDPAAVRVVSDGFRLSVFLLPPVALLARRLWGAFAMWLLLDGAVLALAAAGVLSGAASAAAILVIHLAFAIDTADGERRRLARHGWPAVAILGPLGATGQAVPEGVVAPGAVPAGPPSAGSGAVSTDVIGLFPAAPGGSHAGHPHR